jgi:mannose-6-phosphate isomerase
MAELFKLGNQVKHYEWGSAEWLPRLLGMSNNEGRPWAELWMGSHPASPSRVSLDGKEISLGELIAGDPLYYLGEKGAAQYGALPFLFKLLAAEKPLSSQAHPNQAQAREGFARENAAGLAPDAPNRNYKDPNHKPEIICALTPFTGMCGFREPAEIRRLLAAFLAPQSQAAPLRESLAPLFSALETAAPGAALRNFLAALFGLSALAREELTRYILSRKDADTAEWKLMRRAAELYPHDPALIAPLYLNLFSLAPGEAVFLRAGILHAYIHGLGVELMANSDNVLRGGLTPKHVDVPELTRVLDFSPFKPAILKPAGASPARFRYPSDCEEFSLSVMRGAGGESFFAETGPAIGVVTDGELRIDGEHDGISLAKGESVFIPAGKPDKRPLALRGNYTFYAASLPES